MYPYFFHGVHCISYIPYDFINFYKDAQAALRNRCPATSANVLVADETPLAVIVYDKDRNVVHKLLH